MWWIVGTGAVFLAVAWWLITVARRVDRLHVKVLGLRATLDAQLLRRAQAAHEIAVSGILDPASSLLLGAAVRDCQAADEAAEAGAYAGNAPRDLDRSTVESELSGVLRQVVDRDTRQELAHDFLAAELFDQLDTACYRLSLTRKFHNDAVAEVRAIRARSFVRLFRLAGHAPLPEPFDMDEEGAA